jgi:hypothetical protein
MAEANGLLSARIIWHCPLARLKKFLEHKYGNNGVGFDEWNSAAQTCQLKDVAPTRKPGNRTNKTRAQEIPLIHC